ncbi:MAG TPA: non-heme iron oxygenase ferredoxin subunit [Stellaceae bacterium]|nr:non-heme iron oxygenase ferredoxin subunit [Stellaceae bacterium]
MADNWVKAADRSALGDDEVIGVIVEGREIALYKTDGDIFATDDICTHAYAKLSDGWMEKGEIECPLHAGRFDIKTGKATAPPCVDDVKTYPVRVEGGEIQVKLD